MRVIGVKVKDEAAGEFVLESFYRAIDADRFKLEDMALVTKGPDGKVKIRQTKHRILGKLHDSGVNDKVMKQVAESLEPGQAIVFGLGEDSQIAAIDARIKELTAGDEGEFVTFTLAEDGSALREVDADLPQTE
ncbi:MAG TPA: DUF1269 domain-containing protein [Gaiellaceae bacterium]|jgi:uncharacterized membrane protein